MTMCRLCNGMSFTQAYCKTCNGLMEDKGRLLDYFDDYSAYLDIEGMKLFDGIETDQRDHQCPHLFYCPNCHVENTVLIQEI